MGLPVFTVSFSFPHFPFERSLLVQVCSIQILLNVDVNNVITKLFDDL